MRSTISPNWINIFYRHYLCSKLIPWLHNGYHLQRQKNQHCTYWEAKLNENNPITVQMVLPQNFVTLKKTCQAFWKIVLALLIVFFIPQQLSANPITPKQAKKIAMQWWVASNDTKVQSLSVKEVFTNGTKVLYEVSYMPQGFVLISADDYVIPILGYSFEGSPILKQSKNDSYAAWIKNYGLQIEEIIKNNGIKRKRIDPFNYINELVNQNKSSTAVAPLLSTTWNQGTGWNQYCPVDTSGPGGHAWAGCTAVAMAQVMKYWDHPTTGIGSHSYTHPTYGTLSANFGTTNYNWSSMSDNSADQHNALLLYHCGVAVNMNYGPNESGGSISLARNAFVNFFNYDQNIFLDFRINYQDSIWESLLRIELLNNRPILYVGGDTMPDPHAFVCDGFQFNNYFHMNWGWHGAFDGYFYLSNLSLTTSYNFTAGQYALLGIKTPYNPSITTVIPSIIMQTNALSGGIISNNGGYPVLARGVCWNITGNPTILDSCTVDSFGIGLYASMINGLVPNITYYVRSYATSIWGTAYGNELQFTTLPDTAYIFSCGDPIMDIDSNGYNTVLIGGQCWLKENLKVTHYENGTALPHVPNISDWNNFGVSDPAYCFYDNDTVHNASTFGALYTWAALMNGTLSSNTVPSGIQGICPTGWHVPSDEEWKILEGFVDSQFDYPDSEWNLNNFRGYDAGKKLKSTSKWGLQDVIGLYSNIGHGTDNYGFSALPGGYRLDNSFTNGFYDNGTKGIWWSTTSLDAYSSYNRSVTSSDLISRSSSLKGAGLSVRCLRDTGYVLATILTDSITNISQLSATGGGSILDNGGATITEYGLCWNTVGNPTLLDSFVVVGAGTDTFTVQITNLQPDETYYVSAYAINYEGIAYGDEVQFTTPPFTCGAQIVDYDGNIYNTVLIGDQCWMQENLRTTHYSNGVAIPNVTNSTAWENMGYNDPAYCYYNNSSYYGNNYGALYTWAAIMNGEQSSNSVPSGVQGICPNGWHVPSDEEWKILSGSVDTQHGYPNSTWESGQGGGFDAGLRLKTTSGWNSGGNGNDIYNFSGQPTGRRFEHGLFSWFGAFTYFWTSTEYNAAYSVYRGLSWSQSGIGNGYVDKENGFNIRCLKDSVNIQAEPATVVTDSIYSISHIAAQGTSEVISSGNSSITARGFCWNTAGNPSISDSLISNSKGLGTFTHTISGLESNTTYFIRAFATNSIGTAYGNQIQFTTLQDTASVITCGDQISDIDGNVYNTVNIGNQCWMKENLNTTHDALGASITRYCYANNSANCISYGGLYKWNIVMNGEASSNAVPSGVQGICPFGWHIPSDEEWKILEGAVDSQYDYPDSEWDETGYRGYDVCTNLKSTSGWNTGNGTDQYGFSALPGGTSSSSGTGYGNIGNNGLWWSSYNSYYRALTNNNPNVLRFYSYSSSASGYSVRCLADTFIVQGLTILSTDTVSSISHTTAISGGSIIDSGGTSISAYGVCWNTTGMPTLLDSTTVDGSGMGGYVSYLSGLMPNTTYFVRAYATNGIGTSYGNEIQFTTLPDPISLIVCGNSVSDYDGNVYNVVLIGTQCWMKENLKTTSDALGNSITRYCYNNETDSCEVYGGLYDWYTMMNGATSSNTVPSGVQGICPTGWHIPSDEEYKILEGSVDSQYDYPDSEWDEYGWRGFDVGTNLRSTSGWSANNNGNDTYGFSALPGGYRHGSSYLLGSQGLWWSSTQYTSTNAWQRTLSTNQIYRGSFNKWRQYSVRCIKDTGLVQANLPILITDSIINITQTTALGGGEVTYDGGAAVIEYGLCWNTTGSPTISDVFVVAGSGTGTFTSQLSNLVPSSTYFVRAFATNSVGTAYGNEVQFTTMQFIIPVANFIANTTSGTAPLAVEFTDLSTGIPTSWYWDFGDGTTLTDQNPVHTYQSVGTYTVSLAASNFFGSDTAIFQNYIQVLDTGVTVSAPTWTFTITGNSHTILVQGTTPITIESAQIAIGDFIGVFYDSLGTEVCAGYEIWTGQGLAVNAWGEDAQTTEPDGFAAGELFKWKIWRASDDTVFDATASYMQPPIMPNTGAFATNGMSGLLSLEAFTVNYQYINLPQGWSMFSSYIDAFEANIDSLCSSFVSEVVIVKSGAGLTYWPQWNLNMLGNIMVGQGYQVKMNSAQTMEVAGLAVVPETTPVTLVAGWSIIGYLRQSPAPIDQILSLVVSEVIIAKNGIGQTYWPLYGLNMIGNMMPGEGYQVKMSSQQTIIYPPNTTSFSKSEVQVTEPSYFIQSKNTGANMILGIPLSSWNQVPEIGSEIGVFSGAGVLIGSGIFDGGNMAITLWGDDEYSDIIDGLINDEEFRIKIWNGEQETEIVIDSWLEGNGRYETNKIAIAANVETLHARSLQQPCLYQNTPNPFTNETEFSFFLPENTDIEFTILNMLGEVVETLISEEMDMGTHNYRYQTQNLAAGSYYYRLNTPTYSATKKMVVLE